MAAAMLRNRLANLAPHLIDVIQPRLARVPLRAGAFFCPGSIIESPNGGMGIRCDR
jgi:hypothetical protein